MVSDRSVTHATLVLEHSYTAPPARVFDAWADPVSKTRWFTGELDPAAAPMELDFRVGGTERVVSRAEGGQLIVYEGIYRDIVPGERIIVSNWIDVDGRRISVSQFTAEFQSDGDGTRLTVTEQGAYLDGQDTPDSRAVGIRAQLEALDVELGGEAR
ncbi:MAG TPA: SRPBCC domain-containing protein [Candidatus Dormibacteraeota bacterium]|jgi:uncharacterized protein YndB with AHSA1/START domain|nr:SRPBCC domain-containing protein [Candidatus Dormibacteraeota bacterium]